MLKQFFARSFERTESAPQFKFVWFHCPRKKRKEKPYHKSFLWHKSLCVEKVFCVAKGTFRWSFWYSWEEEEERKEKWFFSRENPIFSASNFKNYFSSSSSWIVTMGVLESFGDVCCEKMIFLLKTVSLRKNS